MDFPFPGSSWTCSRLHAYRPCNVEKVTWIFRFLDLLQRVVVCMPWMTQEWECAYFVMKSVFPWCHSPVLLLTRWMIHFEYILVIKVPLHLKIPTNMCQLLNSRIMVNYELLPIIFYNHWPSNFHQPLLTYTHPNRTPVTPTHPPPRTCINDFVDFYS